jgi:hypothetical protein
MFKSGHLPVVLHHDHWTGYHSVIPKERLPLVWPTQEDHHQQGPLIHLPLWKSTHYLDRGPAKHLDSIPPPDQWTIQAEKPVGGAISVNSDLSIPRRLNGLALYHLSCP